MNSKMVKEKLIEAVRSYRELYDPSHPNYLKTNLKTGIWTKIANELNMNDGEEAKKLWLKLRGVYRDTVRRQKKKSDGESFKTWQFQKQLSFLDPFSGTRERKSDEKSQYRDKANERIDRDGAKGTPSNIVVHEESNKRGDDDESRIPKRFLLEMRKERARDKAEEMRPLSQIISKNLNNCDDPLYNFFISMYQQTKTMPPHYQHRIKCQLFQSVSQAEEEIINCGQQSSSISSPSHTQQNDSLFNPCP